MIARVSSAAPSGTMHRIAAAARRADPRLGIVCEHRRGRARHGRDRAARALRAGAQPRRALRLRRAPDRDRVGPAVRDRRVGGVDARLQLPVPATGASFTLNDSRNWFALAVYVVTSAVVSELAARSRRRATESALLAEIATHAARARQRERRTRPHRRRAPRARSAPGTRGSSSASRRPPGSTDADAHSAARRARAGSARSPLRRPRWPYRRAGSPLLPALASLLGVAIDQERLAREVLEAEALRRSDALKTALLRAVSHDLRSPLMTILTSASALSRSDLTLAAADRDELLAGDPQRGPATRSPRLEPARPLAPAGRRGHARARGVGGRQPRRAGAQQPRRRAPIAWRCTLGRRPLVVASTADQIERVLANLIENAVKYSPDHAARVRRRARPRARRSCASSITARASRPRRSSGSSSRSSAAPVGDDDEAPGLGLAIARGFAEANGGRVWAESRAGQGATFVLALPIATSAEDDA